VQPAVIDVQGEIDMATIPQLRDRLLRAVIHNPGAEIGVDLDGVTTLDDTALGVLLGIAARAREAGGDLFLTCTDERILARLERTRLDRAITVRSHRAS
jgi:anti-sigma B factor antagonist